MFSVWQWVIAIIFPVVLAYAGKVVIRPNSPKQRARFFQAAGVGAGLIALSYAWGLWGPIQNGEGSVTIGVVWLRIASENARGRHDAG